MACAPAFAASRIKRSPNSSEPRWLTPASAIKKGWPDLSLSHNFFINFFL